MTPDLPAYLDAQLAAIEDTARAGGEIDDAVVQRWAVHLYDQGVSPELQARIDAHDPGLIIGWCNVAREVIEKHGDRDTLRALAQPFAGGEGWQEGWAL